MKDVAAESNVPFRGVLLNSETPEEIEKRAADLIASANAIREKQSAADAAALAKAKEEDFKLLAMHQADMKEIDSLLSLAGKLSLDDAKKVNKEKSQILEDIWAIEKKYGINQEEPVEQVTEKVAKPTTVYPTIAKIAALILTCWGIVSFSGDWILEKYPNAAIYNDVSFQKVLFAFSVFIGSIAAVIVSLTVFFPGIGKYFNPFNRDQLDFFSDFKQLSEWQRNVIAVLLFFALLLSMVLTVSGKLD